MDFKNAGVMRNGLIYTEEVTPKEIKYTALNKIVQKDGVDEKYYTTTGIERHVDEIRDKSHVEYIDIDAYTEGHYVYRDNFSIEYTVTNNEGKVIYKRTENRYSTDNKIHKEIEDSIENFYKDFNKLAKD